MKKIHLLLIFWVASCALWAQRDLVILHTNDTHSQIEPYKNGLGGYEARYEAVQQERAKDSDLLLLDAGDFMQGSSYFNLFKGEVEIKMMNEIGYDAVSLGNHEFDNGIAELCKQLKKAKFPVVCANYHFKDEALAKLIKPYVIIEKRGLKIGIFGILTNMKGYNGSKEVLAALEYLDPIITAQNMVKLLKETEHCDFVICLSHVGYEQTELFQKVFDTDIANAVGDIDLIVGGHTHKLLAQPDVINGVSIVQNSDKGTMIGKMVVHFPD